jgi:hypothetical protein
MEGTLKFNLPEESFMFRVACQALDWRSVVGELDESLRQRIKYEGRKEFEPIRSFLQECLTERNLSLLDE